MTKRQDIVDRLISLFETILISNGYQTDIGANVHDFETHFQDEDLPALSVCDLVADIEFVNAQKEAPAQQKNLNLQLKIFTGQETKVTNLRLMLADINKCLGTDKRLGESVLWINPTREGIISDDQTFEIAGAAIELEVAYLINSFDDYI